MCVLCLIFLFFVVVIHSEKIQEEKIYPPPISLQEEISLLQNQSVQQNAEISLLKSQLMNLAKKVELNHPTLGPSVCSNYTELSDDWRKIDYDNPHAYSPVHCDQPRNGNTNNGNTFTNLTTGWYRFTGAAGTKLPTSPTHFSDLAVIRELDGGNGMICGTHAVGWISSQLGGHPIIQEGVVTRDVCWEYRTNNCEWTKTTIRVAACRDWDGDYFVYELQPTPDCSLAYCALE